jgi:acyl-CoA dehydrogenase
MNEISGRSPRAPSGEQHRLLRESVRAFTAREIAPQVSDWERAGELPRALHEKAAAAGLLGIGFREDVGGAGGDLFHMMVVIEELIEGGGSSGVCAGLFTHTIALPHIVAAGDPGQIDRFVRPTLAGRTIGALAVTEPDAGSDVAALRTRAVRDGDDYVVNGTKTYITSGARADFVTVAVRTGEPGHRGLSLLVVEKGTPGFTVGRRLEKLGWWCSDTAELSFADARVPATNRVGPEGTGFRQIVAHFQTERLFMATLAYATAQRALDLAIAWAKARRAFGERLADKPVLRHKLAEMARRTDVAREYVPRGRGASSRRRGRRARGRDGEEHRRRGLPVRGGRGRPDPRRARLHAGERDRAPLPRRADPRHRRRNDRDHERGDRGPAGARPALAGC